ncbi:hypothetical protein GGR34_002277 [Microvirga flocculans]|uniref:Uncharacterized protein n=1 Tax=Microvirga flocculans TaxID=217168 RepID=A0A7W6N8N3_9HYPH|nr:hypothetical protein [Microvirga flocculans]MBB4040620.1 hypothetical protein [Microvirga flocculans]
MMSRFNEDGIDRALDADDCSHHCPSWFLAFLAGLALLGLVGHQLTG